jgi:uncharacterized protein (DUF2336 family)
MNALAPADLISELEVAARDGTPERRMRMLRCATELFVASAARLSPGQIDVFDHVLVRLMERVDTPALAELSAALAAVAAPPPVTIQRLAHHENPAVATPVLGKSPRITDPDLIEVVRHRGQQHLVAISGRQPLGEAVTDVILKYAGKDVARLLARNPAARFNSLGYAALLIAAERDDNLAEALASRPDLPPEMLRSLLLRTTATVRARLLKSAPVEVRDKVQAALKSAGVAAPETAAASNDYAEAKAAVVVLNKSGKLNDSSVNRFAIRREYPNVIAALSLLSGGSLEVIAALMEEESGSGLIIACRGSRLNWQTTAAVLNNRRVPPLSRDLLDQAKEVFDMLYVSSAQYTIRFEPPEFAASRLAGSAAKAAAGGRR